MTNDFKSFLLEYLTPDQKKKYSDIQVDPKARAATDHYFGTGNDKVTGDIEHGIHEDAPKSEIHKEVERHLGHDLTHKEYRTNSIKDKYGRDTKITKAIKDPAIRERFNADETRQGSTKSGFTYSVHRGTEVAGQTNQEPDAAHPSGHSWKDQSCKNLTKGAFKAKVKHEIKQGAAVHFVHDEHGKEIYRATLQPHHDQHGNVAYAVDGEYGVLHPDFRKSAEEAARKLTPQTGATTGLFKKHKDVYNDNGKKTMLHPHLSDDDVEKMNDNRYTNLETRIALASHPKTSDFHLDNYSYDDNHKVRHAALMNPNAKETQVHGMLEAKRPSAYSDPQGHRELPRMKMDALRHPHAPAYLVKQHLEAAAKTNEYHHGVVGIESHHITKDDIHALATSPDTSHILKNVIASSHKASKETLDHLHETAKYAVAANPRASAETLHKIATNAGVGFDGSILLKSVASNPSTASHTLEKLHKDGVHVDTIATHRNASGALLSSIVKGSDAKAASNVFVNPSHTADHVSEGLASKKKAIRIAAINSPKATKEHITSALGDKDEAVRDAALDHVHKHNVSIDHLLDSPHVDVRVAGTSHPNATSKHLMRALDDKHEKVSIVAARHDNLTPKHIEHAMSKGNTVTAWNAIQNKNATSAVLNKAYDSGNANLKSFAVRHPNASSSMISKAANDESRYVRADAMANPNATEAHHMKGLKDSDLMVASEAAKHTKSEKVLSKALDHDHVDVQREAINNPHATANVLVKGAKKLKDSHWAMHDVVSHKNAPSSLLHDVLTDPEHHHTTKREASLNKNLSAEHVESVINSGDRTVAANIIRHNPNVTAHHINKAIEKHGRYGSWDLDGAIKQHPLATKKQRRGSVDKSIYE